MTTYTAASAITAFQGGTRGVFNVVDSEANIASNLTGLEAIAYAGIANRANFTLTVTDPGDPIVLTESQFESDRWALLSSGTYSVQVTGAVAANAGILDGASHITSITFADSAANVLANLGNLNDLTVFSNEPYTLTLTDAAPYVFNLSGTQWGDKAVFANLKGSFTVNISGTAAYLTTGIASMSYVNSVSVIDTENGVRNAIDSLEGAAAAGKLTSITMTDGATTPLTISGTQFAADGQALAKIVGGYSLIVSYVTAANAASVAAQSHVSQISVQDSSTNLAANLDALQALAAGGKITTINPTDYYTITVTQAQVTADAQALAKFSVYGLDITGVKAADAGTVITENKVYSVGVTDTAANIAANMSTIRTLANNFKINGIVVTDGGTITVTNDVYSSQNIWRSEMSGSYSLAVTGVNFGSITARFDDAHVSAVGILDSASEIAYQFDSLELYAKAGKLAGISFTDTGAPTLSLSATQIISDGDALNQIGAPFSISGASVASLSALTGNSHLQKVSISDSSADITAGMSSLESLAGAGHLGTVKVTDTSVATLTFTQSQWTGVQPVVSAMTGNFQLVLQGVSAATASAASSLRLSQVTVLDSSANVVANLDALQHLAATGELRSITFTDSSAPILTLSSAQLASDATALADIASPYSLSSSGGFTVAALLAEPHPSTPVVITDSASNIVNNMALLQSDLAAGIVTGITLADPRAPIFYLTPAQLAADAPVLNAISSSYQLSLSGITADNAAATLAQPKVVSVTVVDSAANISTNLDALQSMLTANKLLSANLTDQGDITFTQAQLTSDAGLLEALYGVHKDVLLGVSAAAAFSTAWNTPLVNKVAVSDSAANILANLDTLNGMAYNGMLSTITLTDSGTPVLSFSSTQISQDTHAIAALTGNFKVAVTSVPVSLFSSLIGGGHVASASVSDSAANVSSNFDSLSAAATAGTLTSIALTDGGSPTLTLSQAQMTSDAAALHLLLGNYGLHVSGVAIANASAIVATGNVTGIDVSDTAANIGSDLDALQTLLSAGKLTALAVTDGGSLTVTAAQMISDAQVINDIAGNYSLNIGNASLSALSPAIVSHASALSVTDSGADISSNLDTLQSVAAAGKLTGVTITDSGFSTIAVSASQLTSDAQALNALSGNFVVKIDASAANLTLSGMAEHGNIASFSGTASEYSITTGSNGTVTITDTGTGRSSTDHLSGLTALQFGDHTDIVAQTPGSTTVTTGNVTELYGAVFGRLPDVPGLNYYEQDLQANPNLPLTTFAQWFLASPEYINNPAHNYAQTSAGDAQFIADSYTNLLGRAPEAAAIPYYQNIINFFTSGLTPGTAAYQAALNVGHSVVLTDFSASSEFLGDVTVTAQNPSSAQHWLLLTS